MELTMMGRDVWARHTDRDGKSFVMYHRVWDVGIFFEKAHADAQKKGGSVEQVLEPR